MFKNTPDDDSRLIPTAKLGQHRGTWASAAYQDGEFGVILGVTQGESTSSAIFLAEDRFAEFRKHLPRNFREVFESAVRRLPALKLRLTGAKGAIDKCLE